MSTRLHARTRRCSRREAGFSIVEVIIAAFILAIVIVGATAVAGGTSRTTGATKVRDHQTQVANQMLASLQADPSWATWCRARQTPWNPASPKCDLAPWLAANPTYASLGKTTEGGGAVDFKVSAVATGIDLAADTEPGSNGKDSDGVLPDIYRLSITIAPTSGLAARFQNLHAMTVQSELNPSIRVQTGRVTVDACEALNQIDERIPVGDCTTNQEAVDLLPPPSLDTTTPTTIKKTCDGPQRATTGTDDRDCAAYKCADPEISRMPDNGLKVDCDQYPGFAPPVGAEVFFTRMVMQPVNGSVRLVNTRTGQSFGPLTFNSGRVTFRDLPVGEYDVRASVSGSGRPWKSKSVPSTGKVSVEAGLQSRAVLVFRPAAKGSASIPIRSTDFTIPWQSREWQGWVTVDKNGNTNTQAGKAQICLVPSPQGRLVGEDIPCEDFDLREGMPSFEFKDVEPGLYSAEILVPPNSYLPLSGTGGYLWVRDNGGVVTHPSNGANTTFEYVKGNCAENVRNSIQGVTPPAPYEDWVWQPCNSPGGGSSAGGSGGGGGQ